MPRPRSWAVPVVAALAICASPLAAQPAPPGPEGPPRLESLRLPRAVSAPQGHARVLVGVRLSAPARLTTQVLTAEGAVVRTLADATARPAGRVYVRLDAIDARGFQLRRGAYRVRLQATDARGRVSPALEGGFQLTLTAARGRVDAYTVPLWRGLQRQAGTRRAGQLVAVVAPRGAAAAAGIRRGDLIATLGGRSVASPGAFLAAQRALPANRPAEVGLVRQGRPLTVRLRPRPDWRPVADPAPALAVARRRAPRVLAYAVAQVRHMVEQGRPAEAGRAIAAWPASWRASAPGQLVRGELLAGQARWRDALAAYSRARARDRSMAAAELGRGVALSRLGRARPAVAAFRAAARIAPDDPAAAGLLSYALLRDGRAAEAVAAGRAAVGLDNRYADAFLPLGIALLATGERSEGVRFLRRGLLLLDDDARAARLITRHLAPTDP